MCGPKKWNVKYIRHNPPSSTRESLFGSSLFLVYGFSFLNILFASKIAMNATKAHHVLELWTSKLVNTWQVSAIKMRIRTERIRVYQKFWFRMIQNKRTSQASGGRRSRSEFVRFTVAYRGWRTSIKILWRTWRWVVSHQTFQKHISRVATPVILQRTQTTKIGLKLWESNRLSWF